MGCAPVDPAPLILLADADPDNRDLLSCVLRLQQFETAEAADGVRLVESAIRLRPHLILTELRLPELDGFEAATRLKANPETSAIPIVAVTGYTARNLADEARKAGIEQVVLKPWSRDELVATVERVLAASRALREQCAASRAASSTLRSQVLRSREQAKAAIDRARDVMNRLQRNKGRADR